MIIEDNCYCDFCGYKFEEDEYPSELTLSIDYNTEDPCVFCAPGPESKLRKHIETMPDDDVQDNAYHLLLQTEVIMCEKCRMTNKICSLLDHVRKTRARVLLENDSLMK